MTKFSAGQHISGVLTRSQSARGQTGYQTISYTPELLTTDEIRLIERRVKYGSAQNEKPKWQYYRLPSQKTVITRFVPISEPDEFGRGGRYFTHSLIFSVTDLKQLDDAPFDLMRATYFSSSLNQILELDCLRTGQIAALPIETHPAWNDEALTLLETWPLEDLERLAMLAENSRLFLQTDYYFALVGGNASILELLKVIFFLAPIPFRKQCSFDTNAAACEWRSDASFWARGFRDEKESGSPWVIDAENRCVKFTDSSTLSVQTTRLSSSLRLPSEPLNESLRNMLRAANNHRYEIVLSDGVYRILLQEQDLTLTAEDKKQLATLSQVHRGLELLLALRSGDEGKRLSTLSAMSRTEYRRYVSELRTRVGFEAWHFFTPSYLPTWFELLSGSYDINDLVQAIMSVTTYGSRQDRVQLEAITNYLPFTEQVELRARLRGSPRELKRLRASLDDAVKSRESLKLTSANRSLWRRFRRAVFRS